MSRIELLTTLKEGDRVAVVSRRGTAIRTVVRLTKTLVVLDNKSRFNRQHGTMAGAGMWDGASLADPESDSVKRQLKTQGRHNLTANIEIWAKKFNEEPSKELLEKLTASVARLEKYL